MPTTQLLLPRGPLIRPQVDAVIGLVQRYCRSRTHGPSSARPDPRTHRVARRHLSTETSASTSPTPCPPPFLNRAPEKTVQPPLQPPLLPQTKAILHPQLPPEPKTNKVEDAGTQAEAPTQAQSQSQPQTQPGSEEQAKPEPKEHTETETEVQPQENAQEHAQAQAHTPEKAKPQPELEPQKSVPVPGPNIVAPVTFWQRLGPLTRAGQAYARAQRARPWATQVVSALVIYLCADFGAQSMGTAAVQDAGVVGEVEGKSSAGAGNKGHDWARTARSLLIGGSAAIPGYIWYCYVSNNFNYGSRVLSIATKVGLTQVFFTPVFNVYFFGAQALLSGDSPAEAWRRVCNTVPVSLVSSWKVWPAVSAFSFAFVPFEFRPIFGGVIAVGWQTYLSFLNARAERMEFLRQKGEKETRKEKEKGEVQVVPLHKSADITQTIPASATPTPTTTKPAAAA